jgi:hypothetical protein
MQSYFLVEMQKKKCKQQQEQKKQTTKNYAFSCRGHTVRPTSNKKMISFEEGFFVVDESVYR